jgi:hypothetical protein
MIEIDGPELRRRMHAVWAPDDELPALRDAETEVFDVTQDMEESVRRGDYGKTAAEWTPEKKE